MKRAFVGLAFCLVQSVWAAFTPAQDLSPGQINGQKIPDELRGVGITEHLGDSVDTSLIFRDETGQDMKLSSFFAAGKPVLLSLVYYGCPNLCTFSLNGLVSSLKRLEWTPGKEFDVVVVSIDPRETAALAVSKKGAYLASYGKPETASGWHFLTAREDQVKKLADQVGFGYRYDPAQQQYAHSAALFAITPEGKISRYLYGIDYPVKDVRLALLEASSGKIGTIVDRLLLFCYRYDPQTRKYSVYLTRLMQAAAALTVLVLGGTIAAAFRRG